MKSGHLFGNEYNKLIHSLLKKINSAAGKRTRISKVNKGTLEARTLYLLEIAFFATAELVISSKYNFIYK